MRALGSSGALLTRLINKTVCVSTGYPCLVTSSALPPQLPLSLSQPPRPHLRHAARCRTFSPTSLREHRRMRAPRGQFQVQARAGGEAHDGDYGRAPAAPPHRLSHFHPLEPLRLFTQHLLAGRYFQLVLWPNG